MEHDEIDIAHGVRGLLWGTFFEDGEKVKMCSGQNPKYFFVTFLADRIDAHAYPLVAVFE